MTHKPYTNKQNLLFAAKTMGYKVSENAKAFWFDVMKVRHIYYKSK